MKIIAYFLANKKTSFFWKIVVCILYPFFSYSQTGQCLVQGYIKGGSSQQIFFSYKSREGYITDTVQCIQEKFSYIVPSTLDSVIEISIKSYQSAFFWQEEGSVNIVNSDKYLDKLIISGTPENDVLNLYRQNIEWINYGIENTSSSINSKKKENIINFIRKFYDKKTSVYLLYMLVSLYADNNSQYIQLFDNLSYKVKNTEVATELSLIIGEMKKKL
jgi:hypothetical protein